MNFHYKPDIQTFALLSPTIWIAIKREQKDLKKAQFVKEHEFQAVNKLGTGDKVLVRRTQLRRTFPFTLIQ